VVVVGGNEKVYKEVSHGAKVVVRRIPQEREEGIKEFLVDISILGRIKHKYLARFLFMTSWAKEVYTKG